MQIKTFVLPVLSHEPIEEELNRFLRGHRVLQVERHFCPDSGGYWAILVEYVGTFQFGRYHFFTVFDPKQRTICAASFPERVAFHAMMRICHPVFDNYQTPDSFASRKGLGQYAAIGRAQQLVRHFTWYAKLDVCKYFDSIDHGVMLAQLARLFKDRQLLLYFRDLLLSYETTPGCGLPIGNLTSQYFANHYLAVADHHARQQLHVAAMVRYMDDILLFCNDEERLMQQVHQYNIYARETLHLQMHPPVVNRSAAGVPFLGYVVMLHHLRLNGRSQRRLRHKMGHLNYCLQEGFIDDATYARHATCLLAFAEKAAVTDLKRKMNDTPGMYPQGLQPREPWRQLEQQRLELPCVEPEQQHA